jgi:predicted DNA-binding protein
MRVQLQLSIEHTLKERLQNVNRQTRIPVSAIISGLLEKYLHEVEELHHVQTELPRTSD